MKYIFLLFSIITACKQPINQAGASGAETYATHLYIRKHSNYTSVKIREPWPGAKDYTYILSKNARETLPDSLLKYPFISIPLQNIVVTSTTHLPALEMLGVTDHLIAFPHTEYVSSPLVRKRIEQGKVKEIGSGMQLNTEAVLQLKPEILMVFSSGQDQRNYDVYQKNGIPVLYNADWMEQNPLGRSEWIKLFGLLFDKEQKADSIFRKIESDYLKIKTKIADKKNKPKVFQGGKFGDKWYVPGGKSYAAHLISDAGGDYLLSDDTHNGGLQLNYENALLKLVEADYWLNPGMITNKKQILEEFEFAKELNCVKNDKVFTYNLSKGATGGVLYFEQSNMHPDWVLSDLYHIFYPDDTDYTFRFYQALK